MTFSELNKLAKSDFTSSDLKNLRTKIGAGVAEVAEFCGYSRAQIYATEAGKYAASRSHYHSVLLFHFLKLNEKNAD